MGGGSVVELELNRAVEVKEEEECCIKPVPDDKSLARWGVPSRYLQRHSSSGHLPESFWRQDIARYYVPPKQGFFSRACLRFSLSSHVAFAKPWRRLTSTLTLPLHPPAS